MDQRWRSSKLLSRCWIVFGSFCLTVIRLTADLLRRRLCPSYDGSFPDPSVLRQPPIRLSSASLS